MRVMSSIEPLHRPMCGIIVLFFGLVHGGAEGIWLDAIYPPTTEEENDIPRVYK